MRHRIVVVARIFKSFNPRICKRCDKSVVYYREPQIVSIHASVKDATLAMPVVLPALLCFNPRICKRCDDKKDYYKQQHIVSIHASVKDATVDTSQLRAIGGVSIHASVKDATRSMELICLMSFCFNPRICKRCDFVGVAIYS